MLEASRSWVLLSLSETEPAEDIVKRWFFDEKGGGSDVPFQKVVFFPPLEGSDIEMEWYHAPDKIDPYNHALFVFYRIRRYRNQIEVLGTIEGAVLWKTLGGNFAVRDMQRRTRCLLSSPSISSVDDGEPFYFPVDSVFNLFEFNEKEELRLAKTLEKRVTWLLRCYIENDHTLPVPQSAFSSPTEDAESFILMEFLVKELELSLLHLPFDGVCDVPRDRLCFDKVRLSAERHYFFQRFSRFRSEDAVCRLFKFNQLNDHLVNNNLTADCSPLDMQVFYLRFAEEHRLPPPRFMFRAPLEEVPVEIAKQLPLYPDGMVHLSYLDVAPWIWNCYEIACHRHAVLMSRDTLISKPWIKRQALRISQCIALERKKHGRKRRQQHWNVQNPLTDVDPQAGFSLKVQDLIDALPRCLREACSHFPKNMERLTFVQTLAGAGVSLDMTVALFENLNERYPKASAEPLKTRFNVEAVWKRNYSPAYCKTIIDCQQQATGRIRCPIAKETGIVNSWGIQFHCKQEGAIPDIEDMKGPHMYLKYQLTKGRGAQKTKRSKNLADADADASASAAAVEGDEDMGVPVPFEDEDEEEEEIW